MPANPELFKKTLAVFVREFKALSSQETDPMEAYHHANYALSAMLCILSEQMGLEVDEVVAGIIDQYEEIAARAGVDFSPYEEYEE